MERNGAVIELPLRCVLELEGRFRGVQPDDVVGRG